MPDPVAPAFDFESAVRSISAERAPGEEIAAALRDPLALARALMRCPSVTPYDADALGVLYGRGACDMKGAIACFVAAVARFVMTRPHGFPGALSMLIAGDEEGDATAGTEPMLAWLAGQNDLPEVSIVGEPTCRAQLGDIVKIDRRGQLSGTVTH
jgi:acetylornithine deacetylase/succinyl-diaminopimelate desuccinylase-like protein